VYFKLVYNYVKYNQNIPKVYSNQYSVQKVGKNLDASEKWYQKAEIHDLNDEKSLIPPDFYSTCYMVQNMRRHVHIQLHDKIVWMPIIQMEQPLTKNHATKKSKNAGLKRHMQEWQDAFLGTELEHKRCTVYWSTLCFDIKLTHRCA
jgi:hypothetical protein